MSFGIPKKIEIKCDDATVQNMLTLLKLSPFPDKPPIDADTPWKLGIDYDYLKKLKNQFENEWSWTTLENKISMHVKSPRSDAIPLILLHGWPGTFFNFHKVVEPLTSPENPNHPAFHVIIPSLPGFFLSTLPRHEDWGLASNARLFNGLMTSVLGYKKYVGQGGDWPITIGLAIASSPLAILAYIGEKIYSWSDPELVDPQDILDTVALYYMSGTFATSVVIYNTSSTVTQALYAPVTEGKFLLNNKFGFSGFPYEIICPPRSVLAMLGPLAYYKEHSSGGHFPALDSPVDFVGDLREFVADNKDEAAL